MAYIVKIPEAAKEQIRKILETRRPKGRHMRYLAYIYYRYTRRTHDVDAEVDSAMMCGYCQAKIIGYFNRQDWI